MELSEGNLYPSNSNEPLYARKTQQNINSLNTNYSHTNKNIIGTEAISVPIIL